MFSGKEGIFMKAVLLFGLHSIITLILANKNHVTLLNVQTVFALKMIELYF